MSFLSTVFNSSCNDLLFFDQDKNLNGELETMSKETGKLEQKMRSLKDDLSAKNKHSKELEKEVR